MHTSRNEHAQKIVAVTVATILTGAYLFGCLQLLVFVLNENPFVMSGAVLGLLSGIVPVSLSGYYGSLWLLERLG
jgi:hypothetical protein